MRPFPWIIRVSLFAVGFGIGVSQFKAPPQQQPIVLELHLAIHPDHASQFSSSNLRCVEPRSLRTGL